MTSLPPPDKIQQLNNDFEATLQCLAEMLGQRLPTAVFRGSSLVTDTFPDLQISVSYMVITSRIC